MAAPGSRPSPTLATVWTFLAVALPTLAALLASMPSVDLAYQLRAGGGILDTGSIPTTDTWTFTIAGQPWTDQQWGAQVLLAAVYRAAGWNGLFVLRAALVGLAFWLLLRTVEVRAPWRSARVRAFFVLGALLVAAPALALRPQLFAIVLFAATLLLLADRGKHPRRIWLIPVLTLAWAILHGSFPLALVVLGLAVLADLLNPSPTPFAGSSLRRRLPVELLAVTVVSALATLVNPFGLDVWGYVIRLSTNPTIGSRVSEWRPTGITDLPGILFWLSVVAVVAAVAAVARQRLRGGSRPPFPIAAGLTLLVFAALGAITGRGIAWWPFAAVFVISGFRFGPAPSPGAALDPNRRPSPDARRSPLNTVLIGALGIAGVALLPFWRPVGPAGVPLGVLSYAPEGIAVRLTALVVAQRLPPEAAARLRVWAPQVWGSWLELEAPAFRYAVDSRIELFPAPLWADDDTIENAAPGWQDVLARDGVSFVVTMPATPLDAAIRTDPSFQQVYTDGDGAIWLRTAVQG